MPLRIPSPTELSTQQQEVRKRNAWLHVEVTFFPDRFFFSKVSAENQKVLEVDRTVQIRIASPCIRKFGQPIVHVRSIEFFVTIEIEATLKAPP